MKSFLRPIFLVCLTILVTLSACEIRRGPDGPGDIVQIDDGAAINPPPPNAPSAELDTPDDLGQGEAAAVAPPADAVEPNSILVKLNPQAADAALRNELNEDAGNINAQDAGITGNPQLDDILRQAGIQDAESIIKPIAEATDKSAEIIAQSSPGVSQVYALEMAPGTDPQAAIASITQAPEVEYAEPNYIAGMTAKPIDAPNSFEPDDPYYKYQWNLAAIQMPSAWEISTGQGVVVAIIDTGVDFKAPDMQMVKRVTGYDFVNDDEDPTDDQGHGTHVAGTVAESTNNGTGVASVAFNAQILPIKSLDNRGQGSYENIIKGIVYAVDQGAKVINMSLAGRNDSQALKEAVTYARNKGVLVVAAAGNSGSTVEYPAAYNDLVLSVGSTRFDNSRADYSNFGEQIDIMAPGGDVDVDLNGDGFGDGIIQQTLSSSGEGYTYRFFEGTSMASPHIAGVAALMYSVKPNASPAEVEAAIVQTALNLGDENQYGAGLVQAANALQAFGQVIPTPIAPTSTPTLVVEPTATGIAAVPATMTPIPAAPTATTAPATTPPDVPTAAPTSVPNTPTPPPLPTVTLPPPSPGSTLLINGNFEGNDAWTFGDTPIKAAYDNQIVLSGGQSIRLGNPQGPDLFSYTSIWQKATIPAEARQALLSVNVYRTSDACCGDFQQILILNGNFQVVKTLMRELDDSRTWEAKSYDLSDLKGQTIYVYLGVFNTGGTGRTTVMYVDDVTLTWQ